VGKIRVMLVDDHALVREGTRELLEREEDLEVVAEAGDGEEAVELAAKWLPDLIIMDIAIPKLNGIEATKRIKAARPSVSVLVLTGYDNDQYIFALLEAGAAGYLLKDIRKDELVQAIRAVHAGESVLHPVIARKVISHFSRHGAVEESDERPERPSDALTARELEVLRIAACGMSNREIADTLSISTRTVQVHLSNVFGKLGVGSRTEAVLYGLRRGWFGLEGTKKPPAGGPAA
jgi:two-component system, NarL family, response regulator LiaR